jgi:hypothetical protein
VPPRLEALEERALPATFTVTNLSDHDPGSLRAQIGQANNGDTVNFQSGLTGTITLTSGELQVRHNITVAGPGATVITVSGNNASRVFHDIATATLNGLTVTGGRLADGAGIMVDAGASLTVNGCVISGNVANSANSFGGGIMNAGALVVNNSTVSGNNAVYGGGILQQGNGSTTMTLTNVTVAGNTGGYGAGIYNHGALTLTSSTISGNNCNSNGGGLAHDGSGGTFPATLRNTIVAGNTHGSVRDDVYVFYPALQVGGSYNLIGDGTGQTGLVNGSNHNLVGSSASPIDPRLGPLANNGAPTLTMLLQFGSPALGAGDPTLAGNTDQRGVTRGTPVSIRGYQGLSTSLLMSGSAGTSVYGQSVTFTATVTSGGSPASGSVTFSEGSSTLGTVNLDGSGHAAYTTGTLGAGSHTITAVFAANSTYQPSSGNAGLTVNPAPLTITADNQSKVYGSANPALTATYSGFVNGDTAATALTGALTTTATTGSPVGSYPITRGTLAAANYSITFAAGTLTVTQAPLTITADDQAKVAGDPVPTLTASYAGFVNGDDPSSLSTPVSLSTYSGNTAGSYPIVPAGATTANYSITFVNGTLTVSPAAVAALAVSVPATATAGQGFDLTVRAVDPYGNVDPTYAGTVNLTSSDPQALTLGSHSFSTNDAGVYTFSGLQLFTAGPQSINASDGTLLAQVNLTVNAAVAASLVLTGPSSATAGTPFTVTVTAYDAWGNVATGYLGTVTFSCDDAAATLPADYPFQPGDQGTQTFQVTLGTPGMTWTVTVTDTSNPSLTASLSVTV